MARRPRRFKYERRYRCNIIRQIAIKTAVNYEITLYAHQATSID